MPKFELLPLSAAQAQSATGKRAQVNQEYLTYIEQLKAGEAGSLEALGEGETLTAIRRRLTSAAKLAGKQLVVRRTPERVYFWLAKGNDGRRRGRGRSQGPST